MVSPRPSWLACASMITGCAAELGDADLERHPGAGARPCRTAPPPTCGPASGVAPNGSAFIASARSSTSACSAGRQVVVAQEVPDQARSHLPGVQDGRAARRGTPRLRLGEHQRRGEPDPVRHGVVDQEPGLARGRGDRRPTPARCSTMPSSSPAPSTPRTSGWPSASTPVAMLLADQRDVLQQPVGGDRVEHRERRRAADRVAAERGAVLAGLEQVGRRARGRCRPRSAARRRGPWPA